MEIQALLTTLGLQKKESVIYLTLLEKGASTIADITKATRLHRPTVYGIIPTLVQKNLVSMSVQGKRKLYVAESPRRLQSLVADFTSRLEAVMPELVNLYDNRNPSPKIKFYEGEKMVTWVYDDVLVTCKKGDTFYRYESPKDFLKNDRHLPAAYFERICHKKEIQKLVITNEKTAKNKPKVIERVSHFIPAQDDLFEYDISQIIYNNKVAFLDFNTNTAWIIENSTFAKFQQRIFRSFFGKLV